MDEVAAVAPATVQTTCAGAASTELAEAAISKRVSISFHPRPCVPSGERLAEGRGRRAEETSSRRPSVVGENHCRREDGHQSDDDAPDASSS